MEFGKNNGICAGGLGIIQAISQYFSEKSTCIETKNNNPQKMKAPCEAHYTQEDSCPFQHNNNI